LGDGLIEIYAQGNDPSCDRMIFALLNVFVNT
jgi:acylphosphatase